jgi:4'-phosphopantetheinyl transferase
MHEHALRTDVSPSTVDIWRVDLREVGTEPARLLSMQERERAARIANPARRALWMRGRGVLRMLLGSYLKQPPHEIELRAGKYGKLALSGPAVKPGGFHFNLSHSGPLALYAFTPAAPVGIDLEIERERGRERDDAALAERVFGIETARRLRELDGQARRREFLRLWVRHEAALKCLGTGLAGSEAITAVADSSKPWVTDLNLGVPDGDAVATETFAAVAVLSGPQELRRRDWSLQAW